VPISSVAPFVTGSMACFIPQGASEAPPQKPLSRSGDDDLRDWTQAGHGGARLSPRASRPGGGCGSTRPRRLCHLPLDEFRCAQGGAALCPGGATGRARAPAPRSPAPRDLRPGPASPPSGGPRPVTPWLDPCSLALSRPGPGVGPPPRGPARPRAGPLGLKNHALRSGRPPGRLAPPPADLASGAVARAALEERARQGERLRLAAEATLLWRFALPRAGWWRRAPRGRRPPGRGARGRATVPRPAHAKRGGRIAPGAGAPVASGSACWAPSRRAPPKAALHSGPTVMPKSGATISSTSWPPAATPAQRSSGGSIAAAGLGRPRATRPWRTPRARCASMACRPPVGTLSIPLQAAGG
jgi:hypothetical protein